VSNLPLQDIKPTRPGGIRGLHYRLYDWVLHWSSHEHAGLALFFIAVAEASFFPVPPDVLLIAVCLAHPKKSFRFAAIATLGSVTGGLLGYLIGWSLWQGLQGWVFEHLHMLGFTAENFGRVQELYQDNAGLALFSAAFSPIPYKVFTVAAGVFKVSIPIFIGASLLGRAGRFGLVALMIWKFGPPIKRIIDRYLGWLTLAFLALIIIGFGIISQLGGH